MFIAGTPGASAASLMPVYTRVVQMIRASAAVFEHINFDRSEPYTIFLKDGAVIEATREFASDNVPGTTMPNLTQEAASSFQRELFTALQRRS